MLQKITLIDDEIFKIKDDNSEKIYFSANQEWYHGERQRLAGCGPTTASMLIYYYNYKHSIIIPPLKSNILALMNEMWNFVTPEHRGIPTTSIFCEKLKKYIEKNNLGVTFNILDIPEDKNIRPNFSTLVNFLKTGLENDKPIAFLNLCSGAEENLDRWHWVILFSIEYDIDNNILYAYIFDENIIKKVNLELWLNSTSLGGGFVYLNY